VWWTPRPLNAIWKPEARDEPDRQTDVQRASKPEPHRRLGQSLLSQFSGNTRNSWSCFCGGIFFQRGAVQNPADRGGGANQVILATPTSLSP
jgi:hypothetical protein